LKLSLKTKTLNIVRALFKNNFLEKIIYMFAKGKSPSHPLSKMIPNNYQYPKGSIRKVTRNGITYLLDISDLVDWHVYFGIEDLAHNELYKLCAKGNIIFDIGTNIGCVLMNFSKQVGVNGYVYGFEPDRINYKKCMQNLGLNSFHNISVQQCGLGEKQENKVMTIHSESNRGMNRISNTTSNPNIQNNEFVTINTLDNFIKEQNIQKVDLLKIDVEGYEFNILKGAFTTLNSFHPQLFIELDNENLKEQNSSAKELVKYLQEIGYAIIHAENKVQITEFYNFDKCHFDIICKFEKTNYKN
jgi:FkbM family methyltransferase